MSVQKVITVEARYISGHGRSQVTEIIFNGGNTKEMQFEMRGKDKVLTIHGAEELEAFLDGVAKKRDDVPVYHVEPDPAPKDQDRGEKRAAVEEETLYRGEED